MATDLIKYQELGHRTAETLQGYLHDLEGWQTARQTNDVIIEYKHSLCPGFQHGYLFRGQSYFSCPKEMVFRYIDGYEGSRCLRATWDKDMESVTLLKQIDHNIRINLTRTNRAAMGLISPRDFIDLVMTVTKDDYLSLNSTGMEMAEVPPAANYVRGFNYPSGFICLEVPGSCDS